MRPYLCMLLCVSAGCLGSYSDRALALDRFGSHGVQAGQLFEPFGVVVTDRSGEVYILDSGNHRIERYTRDGRLLLAWGWGVADGKTNALQTCKQRCFAGLSGAGPGQLAFTQGIAIDRDLHSPSYGDVSVVDLSNHRVEKFTPGGRFVLAFGAGVNQTARAHHRRGQEDRCPILPGDRCGAGTRGTASGQFEFAVEGAFIAVGRGGTVYVGDRNRIQEFSSEGVFRTQIPLLPKLKEASGEQGGVSGLAVDRAGNFYVIRNGIKGVREYGPQGGPKQTFDEKDEAAYPEGPTPAIALAPDGRIFIDEFVDQQHHIVEYDRTGAELARFDAGHDDALHGLAYSAPAGKLYVLDTNANTQPPVARVRILTPPKPSLFPVLIGFPDLLAW